MVCSLFIVLQECIFELFYSIVAENGRKINFTLKTTYKKIFLKYHTTKGFLVFGFRECTFEPFLLKKQP